MLHHLLYIFPIFQAIYEYHANENIPILPQTIHQAIFLYVCTKALLQVQDLSMQTSRRQVWWVSRMG